jgi:hypothetical protein
MGADDIVRGGEDAEEAGKVKELSKGTGGDVEYTDN